MTKVPSVIDSLRQISAIYYRIMRSNFSTTRNGVNICITRFGYATDFHMRILQIVKSCVLFVTFDALFYVNNVVLTTRESEIKRRFVD